MSYNDLTGIKKINGIPADLTFYQKLGENDSIFKSVADTDEDLSELDRDILPATDNTYDLGTNTTAFKNVYSHNILTSYLNVHAGSLSAPSLIIGTAGLTSLNNNELSFIGSSGLESLRFMTSGLLLKAANNSQLKIENTLTGSEALWSIGCNEEGLRIGDSFLVKEDALHALQKLKIQNGSIEEPSLSFESDSSTGISKDGTNPLIHFSISGTKRMSLSSSALELAATQLVLPLNSLTVPGLAYKGYLGTGLGTVTGSELNLILNNKPLHSFKETGFQSRLEAGSLFDISIASNAETNIFKFTKSKGTQALPLAIEASDSIYEASFLGSNGLDSLIGAELIVQAEEDYDLTHGTGIYFKTCSVGETSAEDRLVITQNEKPDVLITTSFGLNKLTLATAGLGQEINVKHISKVLIDGTAGNIGIKGFVGGQEGQMLYIYKKVPLNTLTISFNSGTATQKVLLKDSTDYTNSNNYGGITLSFDDGVWREISRS